MVHSPTLLRLQRFTANINNAYLVITALQDIVRL